MRHPALRHGHVCRRRNGHRGCHARDYRALKTGSRACLQLLKAATEHVRVAAFEPHDLLALTRIGHQHLVDTLLRDLARVGQLGHVYDFFAGQIQKILKLRGRPKMVRKDYVRCFQRAQASDGEQVPCAWAAADKSDVAFRHSDTV